MQHCAHCSADSVFGMWPVFVAACALLVAWRRWPRLRRGGRLGTVAVGVAVLGVMMAVGRVEHAHEDTPSSDGPFAAPETRPAPPAPITPAAATIEGEAVPGTPAQAVALYFHRTARCHGCLELEDWARRVVEEAFAAEVSAGLLTWRPVNVEEPGNAHFVSDFGLTGQSLVLARMSPAGPVEYRKLDAVWDLLDDYGRFAEYVAREVKSFLDASPSTPNH